MNINERVAYFINEVTVSEILTKTDLGQSALYKILKGGGFKGATLESLCQGYPNLNADWLLYGIGNMWRNSTKVEFTEGVLERHERRLNEMSAEISELKKILNTEK